MDPGEPSTPDDSDRSISELVSELSAETAVLVRQEMQLAAAEMTAKLGAAARQVALLALGAFLIAASVLALLAAAVVGLSELVAPWAAAMIVAGALGAIAWAVTARGRSGLRRLELAPKETLKSLEEGKQWVKERLR